MYVTIDDATITRLGTPLRPQTPRDTTYADTMQGHHRFQGHYKETTYTPGTPLALGTPVTPPADSIRTVFIKYNTVILVYYHNYQPLWAGLLFTIKMATEAVEGDLEDEIAAEVIKLSRDVLERTVKFRSIVYSARGSGLVDDEFIDRLREQRSSEISNSLLLSMFMDAIRTEEGWFGRFLSLLSDSYSYRPLAEQLSSRE